MKQLHREQLSELHHTLKSSISIHEKYKISLKWRSSGNGMKKLERNERQENEENSQLLSLGFNASDFLFMQKKKLFSLK